MSYLDYETFIDLPLEHCADQLCTKNEFMRCFSFVIGNFDGVHRGHKHLGVLAKEPILKSHTHHAPKNGKNSYMDKAFVLTFDPHPRRYFQPERELFLLTDRDMQKRRLIEAGFDGRITLPFNAQLANLQAKAFIEDILFAQLSPNRIVVGEDFHFGHKRAGTPEFLAAEGKRLGFDVILAPPVLHDDGSIISSSAIRDALTAGDIARANAMLGYSYALIATVIHGEKRGRELGYPTANLRLPAGNGLNHGIYAVFADVGGVRHTAVASFGRRPTFDNGAPLLEVHLFDFSGDLYGQSLEITFISYLRGEEKFASLDALISQMDADSARARHILSNEKNSPRYA